MGTYTTGSRLYKPTVSETGWDDEININWDSLAKLNGVNVATFAGVVGNGSNDDTTGIAAAITAAGSGGTLLFPPGYTFKITSALTISTPLTIIGYGSTLTQATAGAKGFIVSSSDVTIRGLHLVGKQHASYNGSENGISIIAPSWAGRYSRVSVTDCRIENWGQNAIEAMYLTNFDFSHNVINDCAYGGVMLASAQHGTVSDNRVDMGNPVGTSGNAYGIAVTRETSDAGELTTNPRSTDIVVSGNVVSNIPLWEAIETHAGQRISFIGNTIYNCMNPIVLTPSKNNGGTYVYSPLDCIIQGNTCETTVTDGSFDSSIIVSGCGTGTGVPTERATAIISGNTVSGGGAEAVAHHGGIKIYYTDNVIITGNILKRCSPNGISIYHTNRGFVCTGNTVIDPWTDSLSIAVGIQTVSAYNTGVISDNSIIDGDLVGKTHICDQAIRPNSNDDPNSVISIGANYTNAAVYIEDTSASLNVAAMREYGVANVTPDRDYNANATTIDELADVLGTLIADLQWKGLLI